VPTMRERLQLFDQPEDSRCCFAHRRRARVGAGSKCDA
jgi:hypothetical protein